MDDLRESLFSSIGLTTVKFHALPWWKFRVSILAFLLISILGFFSEGFGDRVILGVFG